MNTLLIDTATNIEIVAVTTTNANCDMSTKITVSHSVTLFERIRDALTSAGISINDVHLLAVGIGPGSFTGVRIAVSSARMLAQVLRIPLVGIESQLIWALASDAPEDHCILSAFDAKKGRVFGALYKKNENTLSLETIVSPGDYHIRDILATHSEQPLLCIGTGIDRFKSEILETAPHAIVDSNFIPSGIPACVYAKKLYQQEPDRYKNFEKVLPFYARKSDAEIVMEQKKKFVNF